MRGTSPLGGDSWLCTGVVGSEWGGVLVGFFRCPRGWESLQWGKGNQTMGAGVHSTQRLDVRHQAIGHVRGYVVAPVS